MKKFLLLFSMLATMRSFAQAPINHTNESRLLINKATEDKEAIVIPGGSTPSFPSYLPSDRYDRALYMKTGGSDQGLYRWNGTTWVYAVPPPDLSNYMTLNGTQTITGVKNFGSVNFLGNVTFANGQTLNLGQAVLFGKWLMVDNSGYLGAAPYTPADDGNVLKLTGVANQVVIGNVRYDGFMRSQSAGRYSEILGTTWQIAAGNYINLSGGSSTNDIEIASAGGRDILLKPGGGDTYKLTNTGIFRTSDGASPLWKTAGGGVGITGDLSFTGTNFYLGSSVAPNNGGLFYGVAGYMTQADYLKYNSQFGGYLGVGDASAQTGAAVASFNSSSHTGLQLPYMTSSQRLAINTASGDNTALLAYQTNGTKGLYILTDPNSSSYWRRFLTEDDFSGTTSQYWKGNGSFGVFSTDVAAVGDTRYPQMTGSYTNPPWIANINFNKIANLPAHTIPANTTGSIGASNEAVTFYDSGEQTYSGTITWTGTTAPSGTPTNTYQYTQVGKMVTMRVTLVYPTPGNAVTIVQMDLPSGMPAPKVVSGLTGDSEYLYYGTGGMTTAKASAVSSASRVMMMYVSGVPTLKIQYATGNSFSVVHFTITYWTT